MIIFRYLSKEILATLFVATLVLLVLFITNQSVQFLQRAANGQIPATELLQLVGLQLPLFLGYLLPLALYLGVLLTLGRLHMESEMTVLSACGVSRAKITGMIFIIALLVAAIVAWLMAVVVPKAQGDINEIIHQAAVTTSVDQVLPGRFMSFGKKGDHDAVVFYASAVKNHAVLQGVFMAKKIINSKNPAASKWWVVVAKSAYEKMLPQESGRYLVFDQGYRYAGVPGEKNYHVLQFKHYGTQLKINNVPLINVAQYYSISKLWALKSTSKKVAAELQWRLAMPIATIIFALLAVPLSEVRPRYGKFTQLIPAMLIYMGYADLIFLTRAWMRGGQLSPELGMWWVHGAALLLAIGLMLYRVGWRRIRHMFSTGAMT